MPYIKAERRKPMKSALGDLVAQIDNAGDLNYAISKLCKRYMQIKEPVRYELLNEIIGVLECAKQEFYRMICSPYEDVKRHENGEI